MGRLPSRSKPLSPNVPRPAHSRREATSILQKRIFQYWSLILHPLFDHGESRISAVGTSHRRICLQMNTKQQGFVMSWQSAFPLSLFPVQCQDRLRRQRWPLGSIFEGQGSRAILKTTPSPPSTACRVSPSLSFFCRCHSFGLWFRNRTRFFLTFSPTFRTARFTCDLRIPTYYRLFQDV